ncbi:hypothetical protein GF371_00530 [Candidatus Woesearchaeota archaeon]|nr:hypothetical protein [Candidatus Woesearchaeota archaeon]
MPFTHVSHFRRESTGIRDGYNPPGRLYHHHTAQNVKWFKVGEEDHVYARDGAHKHFEQVIYRTGHLDVSKFVYIIAAVWGDVPDGYSHSREEVGRMIDFFGFHDFDTEAEGEQWRLQNPSVFAANFRGTEPLNLGFKWDGERQIFVPENDSHCEDMNFIFGAEAEHRRHTYNLEEYLAEEPDLGRKILLPR